MAVSLRLGSALCLPHRCSLCGEHVSNLGLHGLSCRRRLGRIARHAALNNLVKHALAAADIPTQLERPDRATIIPWRNGQSLVWDVTMQQGFLCAYPTCTSPALEQAWICSRLGSYGEPMEVHILTWQDLIYHFGPIAVESLGAYGKDAPFFF